MKKLLLFICVFGFFVLSCFTTKKEFTNFNDLKDASLQDKPKDTSFEIKTPELNIKFPSDNWQFDESGLDHEYLCLASEKDKSALIIRRQSFDGDFDLLKLVSTLEMSSVADKSDSKIIQNDLTISGNKYIFYYFYSTKTKMNFYNLYTLKNKDVYNFICFVESDKKDYNNSLCETIYNTILLK